MQWYDDSAEDVFMYFFVGSVDSDVKTVIIFSMFQTQTKQ